MFYSHKSKYKKKQHQGLNFWTKNLFKHLKWKQRGKYKSAVKRAAHWIKEAWSHMLVLQGGDTGGSPLHCMCTWYTKKKSLHEPHHSVAAVLFCTQSLNSHMCHKQKPAREVQRNAARTQDNTWPSPLQRGSTRHTAFTPQPHSHFWQMASNIPNALSDRQVKGAPCVFSQGRPHPCCRARPGWCFTCIDENYSTRSV